MSRNLTISDDLYVQLESISQAQGFDSIEKLIEQTLEVWQDKDDDLAKRQEVVQRINLLREQLLAKYGEQPDSTDLIRADRER